MNARGILTRLRQERKEGSPGVALASAARHASAKTTAAETSATTLSTSSSTHTSSTDGQQVQDISDLEERRVFLEGLNTTIRLLEDPHAKWCSGNGATLWDAALVLTSYLLQEVCGSRVGGGEEGVGSGQKQHLKCIELGAGLGLPGIALYFQGHTVISTERPLTMKLLEANIRLNTTAAEGDGDKGITKQGGERRGSIQTFPLEWTDAASTVATNGCNDGDDPRTLPKSEEVPSGVTSLRDKMKLCLFDIASEKTEKELRTEAWTKGGLEEGQSGVRKEGTDDCSWDVVLGADLIFPNNEECWPALADVWDQLLSSDTSSHPSPHTPHTPHSGCRRRRGYLSYEHRSSHVIAHFKELLKGRGISCERCFSDRVSIPNDIHVYKLCKLY